MISDENLREYDRQGLIPGPDEEEATFLRRVQVAKNEAAKFHQEHGPSEELLQAAADRTDRLFSIRPTWVPVFFSDTGLAVWHGGGTLIHDIEGVSVVSIQLRRPFRKKKKYLGFYCRDEFLAHELAHVGRFAFYEPGNEELFAYHTSDSRFRRFFGPIIHRTWEVWIFIASVLIPLFVDYLLLAFGNLEWSILATFLYLAPLGLVVFALIRLIRSQLLFFRCLRQLRKLVGERALPLIYRLTDKEIHRFAYKSPEKIRKYADRQSCLRWRAIRLNWL